MQLGQRADQLRAAGEVKLVLLGDLDEDSDSEAEDEDPALGAMGRARRLGKKNAFAPGEVTVGPGRY